MYIRLRATGSILIFNFNFLEFGISTESLVCFLETKTKNLKKLKSPNDGYLGSCIDDERSKSRKVV